jgi:hypothetical protein
MKLTKIQLIAGLSLLLSVGASACDFSAGTTSPTSTVDSVVVHSGSADVNQPHGSSEGTTASWNVVPTPSVQATPELDSLALFGSGLLAAGGYIGRRRYVSRSN